MVTVTKSQAPPPPPPPSTLITLVVDELTAKAVKLALAHAVGTGKGFNIKTKGLTLIHEVKNALDRANVYYDDPEIGSF